MKNDPQRAQENLACLQRYHPDTAKGLLAYLQDQRLQKQISPYEIVEPPSGYPTLIEHKGQQIIYLHDKNHPEETPSTISSTMQDQETGLIVLFSCGLGYIPCSIFPHLEQKRMLLVEPEYDILFLALQTCDWRTLLASPNLMILAGITALHDCTEIISAHTSMTKHGTHLFAGRTLLEDEQVSFNELKTLLERSNTQFKAIVKQPVPTDPTAKTIVLSNVHKDLFSTFQEESRQAGRNIQVIRRRSVVNRFLQDDIPVWETAGIPLPGYLLAFSPNVFHPTEWDRLKEKNIKRILWFYDDPFRFDLPPSFLNQLDRIYCFDPILSTRLKTVTITPTSYLPAATSFSTGFRGKPPSDLPPPSDITFVGSTGLHRFEEGFVAWMMANPPSIQSLRQWIHDKVKRGQSVTYEEINLLQLPVEGLPTSGLVSLKEDLTTFFVRLEYLSSLVDYPITLYGDPGWSNQQWVGKISQLYAGRSLDFRHETPWIYQQSKINLNLFNVQCVNSPTLRILDTLACGGFLLTEYRPFLEEMFRIGEELDVFRTQDELKEKIKFYLGHDSRRKEIAAAGQKRVLREHLYRFRFQNIFDEVSKI